MWADIWSIIGSFLLTPCLLLSDIQISENASPKKQMQASGGLKFVINIQIIHSLTNLGGVFFSLTSHLLFISFVTSYL